jgi:hypothetical protein
MAKLSDTQVILLSTAAQRDSGSLYPLPDKFADAGPRVTKALAGLTSAGFAEERETNDLTIVSRTDGDVIYGLFVTAAGLAAIGIEEGEGRAPTPSEPEAPAPAAPRVTKSALVLSLLTQDGGATLPELIAATGWLPHTTRAALTGLRKKGHAIVKGKRDGVTCYTIEASA